MTYGRSLVCYTDKNLNLITSQEHFDNICSVPTTKSTTLKKTVGLLRLAYVGLKQGFKTFKTMLLKGSRQR